MEHFFGGRRITLYASGTAALARAIAECAARSAVRTPEVVLPAYGCPDLVTACIHSAVYPRLVDVASSAWGYDPEALSSSLSPATVAVVAVNLLGIGDDSAALFPQCQRRKIPIIQDSAQFLPRTATDWSGDYVILSFGRGKPMNLLHGGALIESVESRDALPTPLARDTWRNRLLASRLAAAGFNVLTRPHAYGLVSALLRRKLGRVIYKPLRDSTPLPERAWKQIGGAFDLYRLQRSYSRAVWDAALEEWSSFGIEPLRCVDSPPHEESLRLALLAPDRAARDVLVARLNRYGLGASRLYGSALPEVTAIPDVVRRQGPFPNASALADRLFTLPTHKLVTNRVVELTRTVISKWKQSSPEP